VRVALSSVRSVRLWERESRRSWRTSISSTSSLCRTECASLTRIKAVFTPPCGAGAVHLSRGGVGVRARIQVSFNYISHFPVREGGHSTEPRGFGEEFEVIRQG